MVYAASAIVCLVGGLALTGVWDSNPPMAPLTAALFVIASLSLFLLSPAPNRLLGIRHLIGRVCALAVALLGLLLLGEYLTGSSRPSPYTSFSFVLLGWLYSFWTYKPAQGIAHPNSWLSLQV